MFLQEDHDRAMEELKKKEERKVKREEVAAKRKEKETAAATTSSSHDTSFAIPETPSRKSKRNAKVHAIKFQITIRSTDI